MSITTRRKNKPLVIKPFVEPLPSSFEYETHIIDQLCVVVSHVFNESEGKGGLVIKGEEEEYYKGVENVCRRERAGELYQKVKNVCEKEISEIVKQLSLLSEENFFASLQQTWKHFCVCVKKICNIFLYLDRTYILKQTQDKSLWEICLFFFRFFLLQNPHIETQCVHTVLALIEKERKRESKIGRTQIVTLVHMLCALKRYQESFENIFLHTSSNFFSLQSSHFLSSLSIPAYIDKIQEIIQEEKERVSSYLSPETWPSLLALLHKQFYTTHLSSLLAGIHTMVDKNQFSHLSLLYEICEQIEKLSHLEKAFCSYLHQVGIEIVTNKEKENEMIKNLMGLKQQTDKIIEECFKKSFSEEVKKTYDQIINEKENKLAEMLAKFFDARLQAKEMKQAEGEEERIKFIFRFAHAKDVFQAFYKKFLAKRLLLGTSASVEHERLYLSFFKQECGSSFTSKLEGMFKDIELSKDIDKAFAQYLTTLKQCKIAMSVQVLTMSTWPAFPTMDIWLPEDIKKLQEVFKKQYLKKNEGRQLVFVESLATCVLVASFKGGRKELAVSASQASVLLQFNTTQQLSFQAVKDMTRIDAEALKLVLQSLVCLKPGLLLKKPKGLVVSEEDVFMVNKGFTSALFRIRIPQLQAKETPAEEEATAKKVFHDRQYVLDALIVRIMKTRKSLSHASLMSEVLGQVKFPTKPAEIKTRIAGLIERDYLERDKVDNKLYRYMA